MSGSHGLFVNSALGRCPIQPSLGWFSAVDFYRAMWGFANATKNDGLEVSCFLPLSSFIWFLAQSLIDAGAHLVHALCSVRMPCRAMRCPAFVDRIPFLLALCTFQGLPRLQQPLLRQPHRVQPLPDTQTCGRGRRLQWGRP